MGYFDALTSAQFKTTPEGIKIFYPYGYIGRGFIIPTETDYEDLRRSARNMWVAVIVLIVAAVLLMEIPFIPLILLVVYLGGYILWARAKTRNLVPTKEKLTYGEAISNETIKLSLGLLWFFEIVSVSLALFGIVLLFVSPGYTIYAVVMIALGVILTVIYTRMLRNKRRQVQTRR